MEDNIIKGYSLRQILGEYYWKKYLGGSENFKKAIELGVEIQLVQYESAYQKLSEAMDKFSSN